MLKVRFKNDFKKVQTFNNKTTVVTLVGLMELPKGFYEAVPFSIMDWAWQHPSVDVTWAKDNALRLEFSGKSVCAEGDTFDSILGERIAESRAKVRLYKFVATLCSKILHYYFLLLYGNGEVERCRPSHNETQKDCIFSAYQKYKALYIKESHHLGELLKEV